MITVKNLEVDLGNIKILNNISVDFQVGKCYVLTGKNGSGKTTFFKTLIGLIKPKKGKVIFENTAQSDIGFFIDENLLIQNLTAEKYLKFIGLMKGMDINELKIKIKEYLEIFKLLNYDYSISKLSLGNQKKIALISSILNSPKVLLLDEPFVNLDREALDVFINILIKLKQKGTTILISTHQFNKIENLIDYYIKIDEGNFFLFDKNDFKF